jgi:hypothetical protein
MKAALKSKWVAALRSGKYKQVTGSLQNNGGFCCLGVLCDISPAVMGRIDNPNTLGREGYTYAGFSSEQEDILTELNDGAHGRKKRGFKGIATWIEKNL